MRTSLVVRLFAGAMAIGVALGVGPRAVAVEQVREFLDALEDRGYYDMALLYMDQIKDSPLVSEEIKRNFLFDQGMMMAKAARASKDTADRETLYDQSRAIINDDVERNGGLIGTYARGFERALVAGGYAQSVQAPSMGLSPAADAPAAGAEYPAVLEQGPAPSGNWLQRLFTTLVDRIVKGWRS